MSQPAPGNSVDLSEQFDRSYLQVYKYFRYRGLDIETANDLASTVFERALARLSSYDPGKGSFNTWLFAIAHNAAVNHWKALARRPVASLDLAASQPSPEPSPDEVMDRRESQKALLAGLRELDEREREIVALKFAGALTNRQIAGLTGLSPNHVGVILFRALHRLKEILCETEGRVYDGQR